MVVGRAEGDAHAAPDEEGVGQHEARDADEAELLAEDGADEVRVRFGQEEELLAAVSEAHAGHAAGAEGHHRLDELVRDALPEARRVEEGLPAAPAVLRAEHQVRRDGERRDERPEDVAGARARHEEQGEREQQQHHRGAEVGLLQAEQHQEAGDKTRLAAVRLILAKLKDKDIELRTASAQPDDDVLVVDVLQMMAKQRRESITMFEQGGRVELAEVEKTALAVIEEFLPQQMSEAETTAAIEAIKGELGASSVKDMGKVMAELKARHGSELDMSKASGLVKAALA